MARTINEIYNAAIADLNTETALADLEPQADSAQDLLTDVNSSSKVAEHRLWIWFFSFLTWLVEVLFDEHKAEVESRLGVPVGTERWWKERLLAFQLGFLLEFNDEVISYNDTASTAAQNARIVKYAAAVTNVDGTVLLKAAKDNSGEPEPLSASELASLEEYCRQINFAGVRRSVISQPADLLKIDAEVKYDALLLAADGSKISEPSVFPVEDAIENYLKSLPFDGQLSLTHLKDAVQAVAGVNDFVISDAQFQIGLTGWNSFSRLYNTQAGFIRISTTAGETLSDTLTYSAGQ